MTDETVGNAPRIEQRMHAAAQLRAIVGGALQGVGFIENLQGFLRCGQRHGMRGVGATMRDAAPEFAHDVLAPSEHRDRIAVGHRLGKGANIGVHTVKFLYPATRHAKSGLHFVDE